MTYHYNPRMFEADTPLVSLSKSGILTLNMPAWEVIGSPMFVSAVVDGNQHTITLAQPSVNERAMRLSKYMMTSNPRETRVRGMWVQLRARLLAADLLPSESGIYTPNVENGTLVIHLAAGESEE